MKRNLILLGAAVLAATAPLRLAAQDAANPPSSTNGPAATPPQDQPVRMYAPNGAPPPAQSGMTAFGTHVAAQAPTTQPVERRGPATTQISFNFENASVSAVLSHLSEAAGFVILNDTGGPIDFRVNIMARQNISPEDAVTLLNAELKLHQFTAVRMGRILKITTIDKAKKGDIPVRFGADPDQVADTDELITQVIPVRSIDAVKLKQDLQPLIDTSMADITSNGGSNSIIITDTSSSIKRIVEIVSNLDKKDAMDATIRVKQLKYADAQSAATLITTIFKPPDQANQGSNNQPGGGFGGFGRRFGFGGFGGPPGGGTSATADEKGNTGTVVAAADERTNTVVVTGPPDTLKVIDEMLTQLDSDPAEQETFFLYAVKNGQAVDMQATLNSLFGGSTTGTSSSNRSSSSSSSSFGSSSFGGGFGTSSGSRGGGGGFGGSSGGGFGSSSSGFGGSNSGFGNSSRSTSTGYGNSGSNRGSSSSSGNPNSSIAALIGQVYVVADQDTNSLLVATATKYESQVRDIIRQLDRPVAQVLIKCLIAEVTHDNSDDLGLDFSVLNTRLSGNGQSVTSSLGNAASNTANGGLAVSLMESNVTATLHALATNNKIDVLSRPYILASDNQQASVMVGQVVPYISESRLDENDNTINTVTYQNIGIILQVIPHINPDGLVTMQVEPQISDESATNVQISNGVYSPIFDQRIAQTYVAVPDGQTIVIGGLMQDEKQANITKVPILGSLPFVGAFFQRNSTTKTKTELLIFLTPHAVESPSVLKPMSEDELRGLKLTPSAVEPGMFDEHMRGMQRGTTQPSNEYSPSYDATAPETPGGLRGESK